MEEISTSEFLKEILNTVAQFLLVPVILILVLCIVVVVFLVGSLLVELVTERRHFSVVMPTFLNKLTDAPVAEVPAVIEESGLLRRQKEALLTLFENRRLPVETRTALARRLIADNEMRYQSIVARTDLLSRVAPMLGLMATLIPLGPGIMAMGSGDTAVLSDSLLTAFDATVAGLITSVIALAVSKLRKHWYENYMISLETAANTILEKIAFLHENDALELDIVTGATASRETDVETGFAATEARTAQVKATEAGGV
jgi:biopolymer transport protein ExbB/TolQ